MTEAILTATSIAIGTGIALSMSNIFRRYPMSIILPCLYSFLACIGFCIIFNIRGKMIFYASIGGALAWLTFELAAVYQNDLIQYFAATVVLSLIRLWHVHKVPTSF
ncbi:MAG: threonine/serine exporter family protein [Turicibacter sanguinis]